MKEDKREKPRNLSLTEVTFEHEGMSFQGRVSDLSEGGFYIDTINPLPVGTTIGFRFFLPGMGPDALIIGEGTVAWQRRHLGMGVRFIALDEESLGYVRRYLKH